MNKRIQGSLLVALALIFGSLTPAAFAHPFHISVAEIEFNPKTKRFEASLKLHALDLEQALAQKAKRRVNIEKDEDANKLIESYLTEHFFLTSAKHVQRDSDGQEKLDAQEADRSQLHFVGKELETTWIWLYFELELPEGLADPMHDLALVNSVLLDVTDGQINTLTVRSRDKKLSFKTTSKKAWAILPDARAE